MANERLILAIGQMERALTRLETAQASLSAAPPAAQTGDHGDLQARHEQLKTAAAEALAGIDSLLARAG
jgi:phage host-nuclease inhibitor protein Gam